jgi:hypothetical protein
MRGAPLLKLSGREPHSNARGRRQAGLMRASVRKSAEYVSMSKLIHSATTLSLSCEASPAANGTLSWQEDLPFVIRRIHRPVFESAGLPMAPL